MGKADLERGREPLENIEQARIEETLQSFGDLKDGTLAHEVSCDFTLPELTRPAGED